MISDGYDSLCQSVISDRLHGKPDMFGADAYCACREYLETSASQDQHAEGETDTPSTFN